MTITMEKSRKFEFKYLSKYFDFNSCDDLFQRLFEKDRFIVEGCSTEYDYSCLFKMLVVQRYLSMDNDETYYAIVDRASLMCFLGIGDAGDVPTAETLGVFRRRLTENHMLFEIFGRLDQRLASLGVVVHRNGTNGISAIGILGDREDSREGVDLESMAIDSVMGKRVSQIYVPQIPYPIKLRTDTSDLATFKEVLLDQIYFFNLDVAPRFIIDCGANIGLTSIYFKWQFPEASIVAVEPEESNYALLEQNLSYYYPSVECLKYGIWNRSADLFVGDEDGAGKWGFKVSELEVSGRELVRSITMREILQKYRREEIDILKIDIEGSELELFTDNYEDWLPRTRVIMIETHDRFRPGCSRSLFKALSNYNFQVSYNGNTMICVQDPLPFR